MKSNRVVRGAMLAIAAALLVAGLYGPVERAWESRSKAAAAAALKERVAKERADIAAEFQASRGQILARIRENLQNNQFGAAMNDAARYAFINDPELRDLFRTAATAESARLRFDQYRVVVQRDCTEAQARAEFAHLLRDAPDMPASPAPIENAELRFTRLTGAAARDPVQAHLRDPPPAEGEPPADADWITRARNEHRARLVPDLMKALRAATADEIICLWRIDGLRRGKPRNVRFALDLWLSPDPSGRGFIPEPLVYTERRP
jgi:hypothetical protein